MASYQQWQNTRELGRGTFGIVWQQEWTSEHPYEPSKLRAVKQTPRKYHVQWRKELDALLKFKEYEDHFVQHLESFEDEGHLYIAMEYIPHGNLQSHIRSRPLPETEAALVILQLAQGLQYMHRADFIHRDLKPPNILVNQLGPKWHVKISDFGTAKDTGAFHSTRGEVGTEGYMAPEIYLTRHGKWTAAVDIWSLGAIAHCLLSMQPPFHALSELIEFAQQGTPFPVKAVGRSSHLSVQFIQETMAVSVQDRLSIDQVLGHEWLEDVAAELSKTRTRQPQGTFGATVRQYNAWENTFASEATPNLATAIRNDTRTYAPAAPTVRQTARTAPQSTTPAATDNHLFSKGTANDANPDWPQFFAQCGVNAQSGQRYAKVFLEEDMSLEMLSDVDASFLRTLGLKQGDILRVMKSLGRQHGSVPSSFGSQNSVPMVSEPSTAERITPASVPGYGAVPELVRRSSPYTYSSENLSTAELDSGSFNARNPSDRRSTSYSYGPDSLPQSRESTQPPDTNRRSGSYAYGPGAVPESDTDPEAYLGPSRSQRRQNLYSYGPGAVPASTSNMQEQDRRQAGSYAFGPGAVPESDTIPEGLRPGTESRRPPSTYSYGPGSVPLSTPNMPEQDHRQANSYAYGPGAVPESYYSPQPEPEPDTARRSGAYSYTPGTSESAPFVAKENLSVPASSSRPPYSTPSTSYSSSGSADSRSTASTAPTSYSVEQEAEQISQKIDAEEPKESAFCMTCGQNYITQAKLSDHMHWTGHGKAKEETAFCSTCGQNYITQAKLSYHQRWTGHGRKQSEPTMNSSSTNGKPLETSCLTCGKDYLTPKKLTNHVYWTGHGNDAPSPTTAEVDFGSKVETQKSTRCLTCGEDYISRNKLFEHLQRTGHDKGETKRVDPTFTCLACEKGFGSRDALFDHLEAKPEHARNTKTGKPEKLKRDPWYTSPTQETSTEYIDSDYTCLACKREFNSRDSLFWHLDDNPGHARDTNTGKKEKYKRYRY